MNYTGDPIAYAHTNRSRFLAELEEFVRFPTISAQPRHADYTMAWRDCHAERNCL